MVAVTGVVVVVAGVMVVVGGAVVIVGGVVVVVESENKYFFTETCHFIKYF